MRAIISSYLYLRLRRIIAYTILLNLYTYITRIVYSSTLRNLLTNAAPLELYLYLLPSYLVIIS
jgi:hypothetical protein